VIAGLADWVRLRLPPAHPLVWFCLHSQIVVPVRENINGPESMSVRVNLCRTRVYLRSPAARRSSFRWTSNRRIILRHLRLCVKGPGASLW
jgi:hypothetical protein